MHDPGVLDTVDSRVWAKGEPKGLSVLDSSASKLCNCWGIILSLFVQVSLLAASEMEEQLKLAVEELMRTPAALMQALLDHSHGSYSQELYAAARQLEKR